MKLSLIYLFAILAIASGCNNHNADKQKQSDETKNEVLVKAPEVTPKEKENAVVHDTAQVPPGTQADQNNELSNVNNLVGHWFVPHGATINITFNHNGTFEFNDYNVKLKKDELLKGTYLLVNGILTLAYKDRPSQKFTFYKGEKGDENYYIKKPGYYFVKGDN